MGRSIEDAGALTLISTPRSGSTLLSCLLDATGHVSMLNEPGFYPRPTGLHLHVFLRRGHNEVSICRACGLRPRE